MKIYPFAIPVKYFKNTEMKTQRLPKATSLVNDEAKM